MKAEVAADTGLKEVPSAEGAENVPDVTSTDSKTQSEPLEDPTVNQIIHSGNNTASEEVLPPGGSDVVHQLEEKKVLNPEETPVSQEREGTIESDGLELKEDEQKAEMDEGNDIYW